jgi:membrane protease YdiL (CAAX protease family)
MNNNGFDQNAYHNLSGNNQPNYCSFIPSAVYFEKMAVKNTATKIGYSLLFFFGVSLFVPLVLGAVLGALGYENLLTDKFFTLALNIFLTTLGFLGGGLILLKITKEKGIVSYSAPKKGTLFPLLFLGIGFCYLSNVIVSVIQNILSPFFELKGGNVNLPDGLYGFLFSVLSVAVFPALLEEFLFRGVILGSLSKFGKSFAIFTSAVLFGLIHGNLVQIPFAFLVGLFLGFAVVKSGSIWTGFLIHFTNNFISVCLDYLQKLIGEQIIGILYYVIICFAICLGFFGLYLLSLRTEKPFDFPKTSHISSSRQRFLWTMGAPTILICLAFVAIEIMINQLVG